MLSRPAFLAWLLVVAGVLVWRQSSAAEAPSAALKTELQQLLAVADDRGPQAAALAQRRYQSARAVRDDGRADYAYALVLLRLNKTKEASTLLSRVPDLKPAPYVPALQAHVALLLHQKQWSAAIERMERFGRALADQPGWWEQPDDRTNGAHWLGRAASVGGLVAVSAADVERFARADQQLRGLLPNELRDAYTAGFEAVIRESEQLAETTAATETAAKVAQEAEQDAARTKVKEQQTQAKAERENLKLTAEEWKKYLDDKLADFAKQLGMLEKEWNTQDQRRHSLERLILLAQQQQQLLILQGQQLSGNTKSKSNSTTNANSAVLQRIDRELSNLQSQINQYEQDRGRTLAAMNVVYQQAQTGLAQRQALIADYERATGKLVQQDESLKKWNDRLQQKEKDLTGPPKGKAASVQSLERKRKSVGTYLFMDWEAERQRWLEELGE